MQCIIRSFKRRDGSQLLPPNYQFMDRSASTCNSGLNCTFSENPSPPPHRPPVRPAPRALEPSEVSESVPRYEYLRGTYVGSMVKPSAEERLWY